MRGKIMSGTMTVRTGWAACGSIVKRMVRPMAFGLIVASFAGFAMSESALAQPGGRSGGGFGERQRGGGGLGWQWWRNRDRMDRSEIGHMAETLRLDESQIGLVEAMFASFDRRYQAEVDGVRDRMRDIREEMRESRDWGGAMPRMIQVGAESQTRAEALEQSFLRDVREGVLTEEQRARWDRYERERRRRASLESGAQIAGEGVDLFKVVESLDLTDEQRRAIEPTLDAYAMELDRALIDRDQYVSKMMAEVDEVLDGEGARDSEDVFRKIQSKRETIRSIHENYAAFIAENLDREAGRAFLDAFHEEAYPRVYRETAVEGYIAQIRELDSLTEEQRQRIDAINADYRERMRDLNSRLVRVERERELERQQRMFEGIQAMYSEGAGAMRERMREFWRERRAAMEEDENTLDKQELLERERRNLETTTLDAFVGVLNAEQVETAPRPQPEAERQERREAREERMRQWRERMQERRDRGGDRRDRRDRNRGEDF